MIQIKISPFDQFFIKVLDLKKQGKLIFKRSKSPSKLQKKQLLKLLKKASNTIIGLDYNFLDLMFKSNPIQEFQNSIPIMDYSSMYQKYWSRQLKGETNVSWPGKTKYYALSSGTSEAASKYIPVTRDMLKSIKKASVRQLLTITKYDHLPPEFYKKGALMIGGSTHLNFNGNYYEGDLSGITAAKIPFWFQHFYKPGKKISKLHDWDLKLKEMVSNAPNWDIAAIVGVPAWVQILIEKIIEEYKLNNIHELWPNLTFYVHSGVSIAPYQKSFEKLLGKPIYFRESYLASEGYIAFANDPQSDEMSLILNNGIFFEFVEFNDDNFDDDGNIRNNARSLWIDEVEENVNYAILLTTNAGAWRYLIGDTIIFINKNLSQIRITGRTKQYLSIVGEHLSIDNMSRAIELCQSDLKITINEFTLHAEKNGTRFAHHWYIACNQSIDSKVVAHCLDQHLSVLNDDYRVERLEAISEVKLDILPENAFMEFMKLKNKLGGAHKFPRVLKGDRIDEWVNFVQSYKS